MKYYRVSIMVNEEGAYLFSKITEHEFEDGQFDAGAWDKPITRMISTRDNFDFISLVPEYLEALIAGIAVKTELDEYAASRQMAIASSETEFGQEECGKEGCCRGGSTHCG